MSKSPKVTRKQRRDMVEDKKLAVELLKIIHHFFPDLIPRLKAADDPRDNRYTTYDISVILLTRILAAVFHISSMRSMTENLNDSIGIQNIAIILGVDDLSELPHFKTINDCLEKFNPVQLQEIIQVLAVKLIRCKAFLNSRLRGKYWQVIVDGSGLYMFDERHCEHCLTRTHKDKTGKVTHVDYYHYVLEAKIVFNGSIVISICSEFVENEAILDATESEQTADILDATDPAQTADILDATNPAQTVIKPGNNPDVKKQDCELKAFYRLADKLKTCFPKLPICLTMDSLYACRQVFDICQKNNWQYIIRLKDGKIKTLSEEFHTLKNMEPTQNFTETINDVERRYKFVTHLDYQGFLVNAAECIDPNVKYPFLFITNLPITRKNCSQLVADGRRRWCIENQGFDVQKNHGYNLEHIFSEDYNAMKNHYLLIQIGHAISQLLETGLHLIKNAKLTLKMFHELLLADFKRTVFLLEDIEYSRKPCQIRFG
jgi:hypothetical protein